MALCPTRRQLLALGGLTLLMLGLGVLIPAPAHALELDPPPSVEEILKAIIDELFKVKPANLNGDFLQWLIALPDFVGDPGNGAVDGDLAKLGNTTTAIAFAVLTAVATWAVVHYWVSGISFIRGSGTEMLEGITRSIGVALLIIGWPMIFTNAVALVNSISAALVDRPGLDRLAQMLSGAMGGDKLFQEGVAMILGVVISIAAVVLVLGLAITKVVMSVALAVLFVWMPIAFVIWPVPSLAFITKASIQALTSLLAVQVLWAACLATFLAVGQQVLQWGTRGSVFVDGIAEPFVAIALLTTMMMVTRLVLRLNVSSGMGSGGGGGAGVGHLAAPLASVVSTAAGAPMGPAGYGLGPDFATPGGQSTAQHSDGPGAAGHTSEHQGPTGQQGATSQGIGARTVAMPTGASAPTAATASGSATAHAGRDAATPATSGATSGAGAGRSASAEQQSGSQAAGAGQAAQPGAAGANSHGGGRAPDEQPATGGDGRAPINTVGEQAAGETARATDAAAGASAGAPGDSHSGDPAAPASDGAPGSGEAAPAASSQPASQPGSGEGAAGQPGSPGGAGGRGADGADGSPAAGSSAAESGAPGTEPATPHSGSPAGGSESASANVRVGAQEGESASQSAPSGGPAQSSGATDGRGQPNGSPGAAPPAADPGGAPAVSYDWVAGEFRSSDAGSADSSEPTDSPSTEDDDDISDVSYTGIFEAEDER